MIVITGATGKLGAQIVLELLDRVPAERVGVSVRDTAKAADLAGRGVRVRRGDFTDPASLTHAFEGAEQVLVISSDTHGGDAVAQHTAALDAAHEAGTRRVLYTSHQGSGAGSRFAPMPDHAATEAHLAALAMPFTSLRNGFYASTLGFMVGDALTTGEILAPADGPVSWTTHADLAAAAATILVDEGRFDGPTPPLTAPEAHDLDDVARVLADLTGRPIRRAVIDDDDYTKQLIDQGLPEPVAHLMLGMYQASRAGEFATTDPTLEQLLGRPAQSIEVTLAGLVARQAAQR